MIRGGTLANQLTVPGVFLPMLPSMVAVGESPAHSTRCPDEVARFHEHLLQVAIRRLSVLIEPAVVVIVGGIVGSFTSLFSSHCSRLRGARDDRAWHLDDRFNGACAGLSAAQAPVGEPPAVAPPPIEAPPDAWSKPGTKVADPTKPGPGLKGVLTPPTGPGAVGPAAKAAELRLRGRVVVGPGTAAVILEIDGSMYRLPVGGARFAG